MNDNNQGRVNTNTQIRNLYSDGMAYMNIRFYNTNLSFQLQPFMTKDAIGRSTYDSKRAQMSTVNFDNAFALYLAAKSIISGKANGGLLLTLQCAGNAQITLEHKAEQNGQMATYFVMSKNNVVIPFKFATHQIQITENGQPQTKTIETGLGTFMKTIEGYLTGINSDRHLDKMTEDYIKSKEGQNGGGNNSYQNNNSGGYQKNYGNGGGYKKPWQNNGGGGYKKPWNNNRNNNNNGSIPQNSWESKPQNQQPTQQNMSSYQISN